MKMSELMNKLWHSCGNKISIYGEERIVTAVRCCYGRAIQVTLNKPLPDSTSGLFTLHETDTFMIANLEFLD